MIYLFGGVTVSTCFEIVIMRVERRVSARKSRTQNESAVNAFIAAIAFAIVSLFAGARRRREEEGVLAFA